MVRFLPVFLIFGLRLQLAVTKEALDVSSLLDITRPLYIGAKYRVAPRRGSPTKKHSQLWNAESEHKPFLRASDVSNNANTNLNGSCQGGLVRYRSECSETVNGNGGGEIPSPLAGCTLQFGSPVLDSIHEIDLAQARNFSSCAVVGRSKRLLEHSMGPEIDENSAVIRLDDSPTIGYAIHVGMRTTLRVQAPSRLCGFAEKTSELCLTYGAMPARNIAQKQPTRPESSAGEDLFKPWQGCPWLKDHPSLQARCTHIYVDRQVEEGVRKFWGELAPLWLKPPRVFREIGEYKRIQMRPSLEFFAFNLALNICGEVVLYGLDIGPRSLMQAYYFKEDYKKKLAGVPASQIPAHPHYIANRMLDENILAENLCIRKLSHPPNGKRNKKRAGRKAKGTNFATKTLRVRIGL